MNKPNRPLQAFAGYLIDLVRIARGRSVVPHSLNKFKILKAAAKEAGATQFIEVGTFRGVTTARCAPHFEKVYTIELDDKLHAESKQFLNAWNNVECLHGDGRVWLEKLLQRPDVKDVLIFLDGHFSGSITASADIPEPALDELEMLAKYRDKISAIVIDDFRTFGTQEGVPPKSMLLKTIENCFPESNYRIVIHLDQTLILRNEPLAKAG